MKFLRQNLSAYIAQILLIFFISMGTVECLHHDFLPEDASVSTVKNSDTKSASLQKHQLSCEFCKSISSHQHAHFDLQELPQSIAINPFSGKVLVQRSSPHPSTAKSTASGRGPPMA